MSASRTPRWADGDRRAGIPEIAAQAELNGRAFKTEPAENSVRNESAVILPADRRLTF
jgi:hypothetical protein